MENRKNFIFGCSGHGKVIAELAELLNLKINAFFDDNPKEKYFGNIPVYQTTAKLNFDVNNYFIIAVGNNKTRKILSERFDYFNLMTLTHNNAIISETAKIGDGSVIMSNVIVNAEAKIGKHVILNSASIVEHDCVLKDFVHVSPGVILSGNVYVGEGTHIGSGAIVIPNVKIGKWCTIGAGTVVINDIADGATVVGNPGKVINKNNNYDIKNYGMLRQK